MGTSSPLPPTWLLKHSFQLPSLSQTPSHCLYCLLGCLEDTLQWVHPKPDLIICFSNLCPLLCDKMPHTHFLPSTANLSLTPDNITSVFESFLPCLVFCYLESRIQTCKQAAGALEWVIPASCPNIRPASTPPMPCTCFHMSLCKLVPLPGILFLQLVPDNHICKTQLNHVFSPMSS